MTEKDSEYVDLSEFFDNFNKKWIKIKSFKYFNEIILASIIWLAFFLRTRNLSKLGGKYLVGLDPYLYLRQAREILGGNLPVVDYMRNPPIGVVNSFDLFPYILAYWAKFLSLFGVSQELAHIIYPPVAMGISLVFFYLFVKTISSTRVALIASLFLAVIPGYIFRNLAGFADHEAVAMIFMFASLWLFAVGESETKLRKKYFYMGGSGFATLLMALSWGGYPMLILPIALYLLMGMFLYKSVELRSKYVWLGVFLGPMILLGKFNFSDYHFLILVAVYALITINYFIKGKKFALPSPVSSVVIFSVGGIIVNYIFGFFDISKFIFRVINAGGANKVAFTTSEIAQTFVRGGESYLSNFGYLIFIAFAGLFVLSLSLFGNLKTRTKWILTLIMVGSVSLIMLGNWSRDIQILEETYVQFMVLAAVGFIAYYSYLFYYNRSEFDKLLHFENPKYLLPIALFMILGLLAKTAVRFIFIFTPALALLSAVAFDDLIKHARKVKFGQIAAFILLALLAYNLGVDSYNRASGIGSGLPGPWEQSMNWISDNTPEGSVIAHWWDYGYWTQTIGERPSISDGAKPGGDYFIYTLARYGMTHTNTKESLEYFKAHETDYLLYSMEEIGKYSAFAYLGTDKNQDRTSSISTFGLSDIKETRNGEKAVYNGGWTIDDTLVDGKRVIPRGAGSLNQIEVYFENDTISQPARARIVSSGYEEWFEVPCVFIENSKFTFQTEENSLNGCIKIIPVISGDQQNNFAGAMYLSPKVKDGLFARLYLNNEKIEGFDVVYSDSTPLIIYNGRIVGPIKIWKITYPNNLENVDRFLSVEGMQDEFDENFVI